LVYRVRYGEVEMKGSSREKALIALEDGTVWEGFSFGARGERYGEVVFNTSMMGYQEILTDPSYKGQIVTMTYPLIGNYGVNREDVESEKPFVEGFIVREVSRIRSNWRSQETIEEYFKRNNIVGIEGVDTRALTRHIRLEGSMRGVISTEDLSKPSLIRKAKSIPSLVGKDLVKEVTCQESYLWEEPLPSFSSLPKKKFKVVVIDCGVKYNILRSLVSSGCEVIVVPAFTKAKDILAMEVNGVLLSNGPGDPAGVPYVIETAKELISYLKKNPRGLAIMGICLGHQLLSLALGGRTYKLKFGHHGGNHPVKDVRTGKVYITVQNHCFCVEVSRRKTDEENVEITHINLNDHTVEGMRHKRLPLFSVQFHPEASPGPHDAHYLFKEFVSLMEELK